MIKIDLMGAWKFRAVRPAKSPEYNRRDLVEWMPAEVPGTVHTDLLNNGIISDPFYRMQELGAQWVDKLDWEYVKEFTVDRAVSRSGQVWLVAEGLDTFAELRLNGKNIGVTDNMFVEYRFEVGKHIRAGKNRLAISFDSPERRAHALEREHGRLLVALEPQRVHLRKAQYSFGWDWGPKLTTSGIWRNIYLEVPHGPRLRDPFIRIVSAGANEAVMDIQVGIEGRIERPLRLQVTISGRNRIIESTVPPDNSTARMRISIPEPDLWWPNGYGEQHLYLAEFKLKTPDDETLDTRTVTFGLRTVRLVRRPDAGGESFILEVNGIPVFCKGANWIPADTFIPRIPDSTYESILGLAAQAHMNMVRVWGGGIYESDIFYETCDRLGLMVWQDFMFACGEYPEHDAFIKNVELEASQNIRRLRNHPSVVLWCGNNENEYLFCNERPGRSPDDMSGAVIFRDVLPAVCEENDGTRPYWRSSPFGIGHPNDAGNGNHHQWDVWSNWKDYPGYRLSAPRFVTEFGFQSPSSLPTIKKVTLPGDRAFQSEVMEHHNKQVEGTERLYRFQAAHFKVSCDFGTFIYRGQLLQGEALKAAVEHWRRSKFHTAGSLFWQLNDCWPVSSWSVIDSGLRPKAGYYYAKKFFAPVLVSLHVMPDGIEVCITNDTLRGLSGRLEVYLRDFAGKKKKRLAVRTVVIDPNLSATVLQIPVRKLQSVHPSSEYLHAIYDNGFADKTENRHFFSEPKHLDLPAHRIRYSLNRRKDRYTLSLRSDRFLKNVAVDFGSLETVLPDNYFDMDAGSEKTLQFVSAYTLHKLRKNLSIRSLTK